MAGERDLRRGHDEGAGLLSGMVLRISDEAVAEAIGTSHAPSLQLAKTQDGATCLQIFSSSDALHAYANPYSQSITPLGSCETHNLICGTTTAELLRLSDWLHAHGVTHVAMEATGATRGRSKCFSPRRWWTPRRQRGLGWFSTLCLRVSMIRKGRVKWLAKGDAVGQAFFIDALFGLAA